MSKRKYSDLFYRYAFSGEAKCNDCKRKIKYGQTVFVFEGNIFHDCCSENLKGREELKEASE